MLKASRTIVELHGALWRHQHLIATSRPTNLTSRSTGIVIVVKDNFPMDNKYMINYIRGLAQAQKTKKEAQSWVFEHDQGR